MGQENNFIREMANLAMGLGTPYLADSNRIVQLSHYMGRTAPTPGTISTERRQTFYFVTSDQTAGVTITGDDTMIITDRMAVLAFENKENKPEDADVIDADTVILIPTDDLPATIRTLIATPSGRKAIIQHDIFAVKGKQTKIQDITLEPTDSLVKFYVRNLG